MERIKLTENFFLDEFVDPVTFFTEPDNGRSKINMKVVKCVQLLRTKKGSSININGWWKHLPQDLLVFDPIAFEDLMEKKGVPIWSGYRSSRCTIGAPKSAHKISKAVDPKGDEKELFKIVCDNSKEFYTLGLRRLEDIEITNGWLHMDIESRNCTPNLIRVIDKVKHVGDINVLTGEYKLV